MDDKPAMWRLSPEENIKFIGEVRMSADVIIYEYGSFFKITEKLVNFETLIEIAAWV